MGFLTQRCRDVKSVGKKITAVIIYPHECLVYDESMVFDLEKYSGSCDMLIVITFPKNGERFNAILASHRNLDYAYLSHDESITEKIVKKEFGADKVFII